MRALPLAALALLAACANDPAARTAPSTPASGPEALAQRLPAEAGAFRRGATTPVAAPSPGVEIAYATANRAAAGFLQILRADTPLPDGPDSPAAQAAYARMVSEAEAGAGAHRRLRRISETLLPASAPIFRCAALEGTYGRQPVQSLVCAGAAGGQLLRLRVSMPRRDPPAANREAFVEALSAQLR